MGEKEKLDGTNTLCLAVYGRKAKPKDYIGGSEANMLYDAAKLIHKLKRDDEADMPDFTHINWND